MAWAAPAGLVLAALCWFAFHSVVYGPELAKLEAWSDEPAPALQRTTLVDSSADLARISGNPMFALTVGPSAVTEPQLQLEGLAITPKGRSALLSVDGKPASWFELGATRDGVTLIDVQASHVTVDTATRLRDVGLFDKPSMPAAAGAVTSVQPALPQGFRSPPPPASASSLPR